MLSIIFFLCTLPLFRAQATPCPAGSYCPSPGVVLPCTCPAACPVIRSDYTIDGTLSGTLSIWTVKILAGSGGWSGSDVNGAGTAATFNNPSSLSSTYATYNATSLFPPLLIVHDYATHTLRSVTPGGVVTTLAGPGNLTSGYVDSTIPNVSRFNQPRQGVFSPQTGVLYLAGGLNHNIRTVYPNGTTGTLAGNGTLGFRNGPYTSAMFNSPCGLAVDANGALYVSDTINHAMRLVVGGMVSTLAGNGSASFANGIGTAAAFNTPYSIVATPNGATLYIADRLNHRIRMLVVSTRAVTTLAGNGTILANIPRSCVGLACSFNGPVGLALLPSGVLAVSEIGGNRVRLLHPATGLTILLAGPTNSVGGAAIEGVLGLSAQFISPTALALLPDGVTIAVADSGNKRIRALTCSACPAGYFCSPFTPPTACRAGTWGGAAGNYTSSTCAGPCTGTPPGNYCPTACGSASGVPCPTGYWCGGGVAQPVACVVNPGCARGSASDGPIPPTPTPPQACPPGFFCPGFPAFTAVIPCTCPAACAAGNYSFDPPALTFAMTNLAGSAGVVGNRDGWGSNAEFSNPSQVTTLNGRGLLVNDFASFVLRTVTPDGLVGKLAGSTGTSGYVNGVGSAASFMLLRAGFQAPNGIMYVNDQSANRIRTVSPAGEVGVFAGNGTGFSIDGPLAASSFLGLCGMAMGGGGALYVSEGCGSSSHTIREVSGGMVRTLAGGQAIGTVDGTGTAAQFSNPYGLAMPPSGTVLYIADRGNHRIRILTIATRVVTTLAGNGSVGGANGVGTLATTFNNPVGMALTPSGRVLYVSEIAGNRIRSIWLGGGGGGVVDTVVGSGAAGNALGMGALAVVREPLGVVVDWDGNLIFTDVANRLLRKATCGVCPAGHWCARGFPTPCAAGLYDSGLGNSTTAACSGQCAAPPGNFCPPAFSPNATGVPCPSFMFCTGRMAQPLPCTLPALCAMGGSPWDPSATPAPTFTSSALRTNPPTSSLSTSTSPTSGGGGAGGSSASGWSTASSPPTLTTSPTPSPTASDTGSGTGSMTGSGTGSVTGSGTRTPSPGGSLSWTPSSSPSPSSSTSPSSTPSPSPTLTPSPTSTPTLTPTQSTIIGGGGGGGEGATSTASVTCTGSGTASQSQTMPGGVGGTGSSPSASPTVTGSGSVSGTPTTSTSTSATATTTGSPSTTITASPSPSATPTSSQSPTSSGTPSPTPSASPSGTPSHTVSGSGPASPSPTLTPTASATLTATGSGTPSPTVSASGTPTGSQSVSPSSTVSGSPSTSSTFSMGGMASTTSTSSITATPTGTPTASVTLGASASSTSTSSLTASNSGTPTSSVTLGASASTSSTSSLTSSPTSTPTSSVSQGASASSSSTSTLTSSPSSTPTSSVTLGASASTSSTTTLSSSPTTTPTSSVSQGSSASTSSTNTLTSSPSSTPTPSLTQGVSASTSSTATLTASPSQTPSSSITLGASPSTSSTGTLTSSPTITPTSSVTLGAPVSTTSTATLSASPTSTPTPSVSQGLSPSTTSTTTLTASPSQTPTPSLSVGLSPSATPTTTLTSSPTSSPTPSLSRGVSPSTTSSATLTGSPTGTPSPTLSSGASPSTTPTATLTSTPTPSQTPSLSKGSSPSMTPSPLLQVVNGATLSPSPTSPSSLINTTSSSSAAASNILAGANPTIFAGAGGGALLLAGGAFYARWALQQQQQQRRRRKSGEGGGKGEKVSSRTKGGGGGKQATGDGKFRVNNPLRVKAK